MATPQGGLVQGLLQSLQPWMTGGSPSALDNSFSQYGGTQGLLDAMLQASPGSQGAAAFGRAMEGTQNQALQRAAARQQLGMGNFGLQRMAQSWPLILRAMRGLSGQQQNAPQGSPEPQSGPQQPSAGPMPVSQTSAPAPATPDPTASALGTARLGAMLSLAGMPGGQGLSDYAKLALSYSPQIATQLAAAKNPLSQDLALVRQYAQAGNKEAAQAAYFKFLKDSGQVNVAGWSGNVTTLGGLTPQQLGVNAFLPSQGVQTSGGVASPIPGMVDAQEALAGGKALGAAQGKTVDVGGIPVPLSNILGGVSAGSPASRSSGSNPLMDMLRRGTYQKQIGEEGGRQVLSYQEAADSARNANYALDQMMADAKGVSQGPAAAAIEWGLKGIAGVGQVFGVAPPSKLSSYQELDKYANQVAFAATRQMGSREAAQIVHLQMQSNPNKELTATAFSDLAGSMKAMNSYIMAKNVAIQQAAAQSGNPELASAEWTKNIDPRVWDLTLSPEMGEKWAADIGVSKIDAAWPYLSPEEQQALINNIPMNVRKQWLASSTH